MYRPHDMIHTNWVLKVAVVETGVFLLKHPVGYVTSPYQTTTFRLHSRYVVNDGMTVCQNWEWPTFQVSVSSAQQPHPAEITVRQRARGIVTSTNQLGCAVTGRSSNAASVVQCPP